MNSPQDDLDRQLDEVLTAIRDERLDDSVEEAICARTWQRLSGELTAPLITEHEQHQRLQSCADFQALLPELRAGRTSDARRLLVEDHLGECLSCRRVSRQSQPARGGVRATLAAPASRSLGTWGWRLAAAAVILFAVVGLSVQTQIFSFETGGIVHIQSVDGEAFRVSEGGSTPLVSGQSVTLERGESIRTAKDSTAVIRLADDSKVEVRERSELAVRERRSILPGSRADALVDLDRGSVIVEASSQGSGHLFVDTDDCEVAVTGTVFAVSHGIKGSRVSVVEGEVHVRRAGERDVLLPGEQVTTNPALATVPVEEDIAWSRDTERYLALLREVRVLGREMDAAIASDLRHESTLLDLAPADTIVYVGIPNVSGGLHEAWQILQQRVASQEVLRSWWQSTMANSGGEERLQQAIEQLRTFGAQLGDEVVLVLTQQGDDVGAPLLLTDVARPEALRELIARELKADATRDWTVEWIEGPVPQRPTPPEGAARPGLYLWSWEGHLAVSPEFDRLESLAREIAAGATLGARRGSFHTRLAELYGRGVEWIVGVDLERILDSHAGDSLMADLGILDAQHLVAERSHRAGRIENRGLLTFDRERRGMASWLAAPAPIASLDFVSAEATVAAAFVVKDLRVVVDELFQVIARADAEFPLRLEEFEREKGFDVRDDFAAPLGGEFALALDGPVLPTPSWRLVLEVYDPVRLQRTLERTVEQLNVLAAEHGRAGVSLRRSDVGGREYWELASAAYSAFGLHYTIEAGYLIAAPSRVLLDRSLACRTLGTSLAKSQRFVSLLPQDTEMNFSAVVYQNLYPVLDPLARGLRTATGEDAGDLAIFEGLKLGAEPSLGLLYGESDHIVFVNTSEADLFSSGLGGLLRFQGFVDVQQSLFRAMSQQGTDRAQPGS